MSPTKQEPVYLYFFEVSMGKGDMVVEILRGLDFIACVRKADGSCGILVELVEGVTIESVRIRLLEIPYVMGFDEAESIGSTGVYGSSTR